MAIVFNPKVAVAEEMSIKPTMAYDASIINRDLESRELLTNVVEMLKIANLHLSLITGERIEDSDTN